ncbi:MAG: thioredoxin family protein [Deltaproteobacteria bacterium]|nr:thioredoxin family protein [Deltaproteobacteria bacterium]
MRLVLACWVALGIAACGPSVPRVRSVVSLAKLDCAECGQNLALKLSESSGVLRTRFDRRRAEIVVEADSGVDVLAAARALSKPDEYELILGAGQGSYRPESPIAEGLDVVTIARDGADVPALEAHIVAGKVTVMEFGAPWCGPCKLVDQHMAKVLAARADVAYRKLDIGEWDTPLAKRYLGSAPALPYVVVFSKDGKEVDAFGRLDLTRLDRALGAGGAR